MYPHHLPAKGRIPSPSPLSAFPRTALMPAIAKALAPMGVLLAATSAGAADAARELPAVTVLAAQPGAAAGLNQHAPADTGSRLGLTPRQTPASVSVIGSAQMAARHLTRAQDAVLALPGMGESPSPGNGSTSLSARGFTGHSSVAQLVDGTRLAVAAGTVSYPFSTWPLESVQVLRGPASVLQGDGTIGAVVNYVTRKPLFDRSERQAFLTLGQHQQVHGGVGLRGPLSDTLAYSAWLDAARSDGVRRDSAYDRQNASLALTARPNARFAATLAFDGGHNDADTYFGTPVQGQAVPRQWQRLSFNVEDAQVKYRDQVWRLRLHYDAAPGVQLRNESYHLRSSRQWRNVEDYTYNSATGLVDRADFIAIGHELKQSGNRLEVQAQGQVAGLAHKLVAGLEAWRADLDHFNNSPYGGADSVDPARIVPGRFHSPDPFGLGHRTRLSTTALFAESHWTLTPQWTVLGGLRADRIRVRTQNMRALDAPRQIRYTPVTGRLGAVWQASEAVALYGQFATGTDPQGSALSVPRDKNAELTRGRQWEIGAKGELPAIHGEWSVALYDIRKSRIPTRNPYRPAVTEQIGSQSSRGIELALAAEPLPGWTLDANLALLRARYGQYHSATRSGQLISYGGNVVSGAPERIFNLWSGWQLHPQWQLSAGLRHQGRRPGNPANSRWLPSYTVLNAALTWQPQPQASLSLSVQNLADRVYPLSGGSTRWLLGAPRTVSLTGRFTF